jgi:diguanylate cyclase (GGDEF)-like protein
MASTQGDPVTTAAAMSLVVLSGDVALSDHLRNLAAQRPRQPVEILPALNPEAALAALAGRHRNGVVLYDLRGHSDAGRNLLSAVPVLKRHGAVVALVDDDVSPIADAALEAGAVDVLAMPDLGSALLMHVLRHAVSRRIVDQQLMKMRLHESVIGIPSQILFWEILSLAVRRAKRNRDFFAVLLVDLDNLPDGDSAEGPYRDLALRDLVTRIQPILRSSDTIARLETQQLVILVESMPRVEDIQIVAEKIIEEVERPLVSGAGPVALDAAIGIALFPTSAESAEAILARATDAVMQARERGRNRFAFA